MILSNINILLNPNKNLTKIYKNTNRADLIFIIIKLLIYKMYFIIYKCINIYIYIYMFFSNTITKSITNDNNLILIIMKTYLIRYACLISY